MTRPDPPWRPPAPPGRPQPQWRRRPSEVVARRARAVDASFALWAAAATVVLVAAVVLLTDLDGTREAVRALVDRDFAAQPASTRGQAVTVAVAVLVTGAFAVGPATAVAAAVMRAGRGGARFMLVLLLLVTVGEIVLAVGVVAPVVLVLLAVAAVLGVAAAVQMYLPPANRWFALRRR